VLAFQKKLKNALAGWQGIADPSTCQGAARRERRLLLEPRWTLNMGDYEDRAQTRRVLVCAVQVISAIATLSHKTNQRSGAAASGLISWRMKAFQR
jgi:hypothetical protein